MPEPTDGYGYRLAALERRMERLEMLEPAVMKQQLADLQVSLRQMSEDNKAAIHQLSEDLASISKILTGFLLTFAFTGITIVISVVAITQDGGP